MKTEIEEPPTNQPPKQIILYRRGAISAADKAALKAAGYLPIACKDPSDISLIFPDGQKLKGDMIFQAALTALAGANSTQERTAFGTAIIRSLLTK